VRLPPFGRDEVGDGDRLVAMGTVATGTDAATEDVAVGAALGTKQASATGGTLVDHVGHRDVSGDVAH
jgi:hypothetical protein